MLKKLLALMLCAALCIALTACGNSDKKENTDNDGGNSAVTEETVVEAVPTPEPFEPIDWSTVAENPASDFTYTIIDEDYLQIDSYVGTNPVMRIPAEIEGVPVMCVVEDAFRENTTITHVYIPDSLTRLEQRSFLGCTALKQVRLPDDMYSIRMAVFKDCTELRVINMPTGLNSVEESAFCNCAMLTEAVFTENTHTISQNAFEGCVSLTKVSAPAATLIGQQAFVDCISLTDLTIYAGMFTFNGNSFNGCTSLQSVNLMPVPADYEYSYLSYENGVVYLVDSGNSGATAMRMFPGTPADEVVLREDTKRIEHSAFYGCQLKSIIIPANVMQIDGNAFKKCPNLETVTLQSGSVLNYISGYIFEKCPVLKNVDLSGTNEEIIIASNAFFLDEALEKVALPANMSTDEPLSEIFKYSTGIVVTHNGVEYTYEQLDTVPITVNSY